MVEKSYVMNYYNLLRRVKRSQIIPQIVALDVIFSEKLI